MRLTLAVGVGSSLIRPGVGHQRLQHLRNPSPSVISITDPGEAPHAQSCLFSGKLVWRVCHLQAASILLQEVLAFGTSQSRQGSHSLDVKAITDEASTCFIIGLRAPNLSPNFCQKSIPKGPQGFVEGSLDAECVIFQGSLVGFEEAHLHSTCLPKSSSEPIKS